MLEQGTWPGLGGIKETLARNIAVQRWTMTPGLSLVGSWKLQARMSLFHAEPGLELVDSWKPE